MHILKENAEFELATVVSALRKDSAVWSGWRCLCIETDAPLPLPARETVMRLLETTVGEKDGATYFCTGGNVLVFCREPAPHLLENLGRHATSLLSAAGVPAEAIICELPRDMAHLSRSYSYDHIFDRREHPLLPPPPAAAERQDTTPECHRVLLVEDDPVTRWLVRCALKGECLLSTAQGAKAAITSYRAFRPDVVFLDLGLPDGRGQDVLKEILKADPLAYIVIFSSHDTMENIVSALDNGARGFIPKPFNRELMLAHLQRAT